MKPIMNRDDAWRIGTVGLGEVDRAAVVAAYRERGGTLAKVDVGRLRLALRDVRRGLEDRGRLDRASDITRREDSLGD